MAVSRRAPAHKTRRRRVRRYVSLSHTGIVAENRSPVNHSKWRGLDKQENSYTIKIVKGDSIMPEKYKWEYGIIDYINKKQIFFLAAVSFLALLIRFTGFNFIAEDYTNSFSKWIEYLRENGHFRGIASLEGTDYFLLQPATYQYFMAIISYLPPGWDLWSVKILSCVFDFVLAFTGMNIAGEITKSGKYSLLAYTAVLFCPTVFANSGIWGQNDSIYAAFLFAALYFFLKERPGAAMLFFGIGLSFKLQAMFILPFTFFIYLLQKWSILNYLYAVLGFILTQLPCLFIGVPVFDIVKKYALQSGAYGQRTMNAPTIFALIPVQRTAGMLFAAAVLVCLVFALMKNGKTTTPEKTLLLFVFCSLIIPFLLPRMHERYFYLAEVSALLYVVCRPDRLWVFFLILLASLSTYGNYLFKTEYIPLHYLAAVMFAAVIAVSKWVLDEFAFFNNTRSGKGPAA
jgi:Gpi18-like mannosyltransferase